MLGDAKIVTVPNTELSLRLQPKAESLKPACLVLPYSRRHPIDSLTSHRVSPTLEAGLSKADPTSGGVTVSTEMLAAKRHAGVHTPVIACKMIIANQQMAYAA